MNRLLLTIASISLITSAVTAARADDLIWATGKVYSADGRRPLRDALVAVYDQKNHVIDYAKTDEEGDYALAVPRSALNLGKKGGGFFYEVAGSVTRFAGGVGKIVAMPVKAGIRAAAAISTATDPITRAGIGAASGVAQTLVDTMSPRDKRRQLNEREQPGAIVMKVSLPGHNDVVTVARVYWMQEEIHRAGGKEQRTLAAWFDPANLTNAVSEKPSTVTSTYHKFSSVRLEPSIAEAGQTVTVTATFPSPIEPRAPVVVVARNTRTGKMIELTPIGRDRYRGEFVVEKNDPKDDQIICVLAYAQLNDHEGRTKKVEDAIHGAGLWDIKKPYSFNPLLVVSRNRGEAALTVVAPTRRR